MYRENGRYTCAWSSGIGTASAIVGARASIPTTTAAPEWPMLCRRSARSAAGAGHDQWLRRTVRQLQPHHHDPQPPAQDGHRCDDRQEVVHLTEVSHYVARVAELAVALRIWPTSGRSAFADKQETYCHAVVKVERSHQHIDPYWWQRERIVVQRAEWKTFRSSARSSGRRGRARKHERRCDKIKDLENQGSAFEGCQGSVAWPSASGGTRTRRRRAMRLQGGRQAHEPAVPERPGR